MIVVCSSVRRESSFDSSLTRSHEESVFRRLLHGPKPAREPPCGGSLARCTSTAFRRPPYRRATPLPCSKPSFDDSVHVRRTQIIFRQPMHAGSPHEHLSMLAQTARGRRFAGCSRVFQRSPAHAVQRSRPCTSFDAHVRARRAMSTRRQPPRCLRSSASLDANFRSLPKAPGSLSSFEERIRPAQQLALSTGIGFCLSTPASAAA